MPLLCSGRRSLRTTAPIWSSRRQARSVISEDPAENRLRAEPAQQSQAGPQGRSSRPCSASPPRSGRPSASERSSIRPKSWAWTTLFQPTPSGRSRSKCSRRMKKTPAPSGPSSHLWPSAARKSIGVWPNVQGEHAEALDGVDQQQGPAVVGHLGQPVQVVSPTAGVADPTDRRRCGCGGRRPRPAGPDRPFPPSVGTRRVSTPRSARFIQGYWFEGNSSARVTTLSPGCQGNPSATRLIPAVVLPDQGDLLRRGPDQFGKRRAELAGPAVPIRPGSASILGRLAGPVNHGRRGRGRQWADGRMIEVRPPQGDRHLLPEFRPIDLRGHATGGPWGRQTRPALLFFSRLIRYHRCNLRSPPYSKRS